MILPIVFICLASVDDLCALSVVANKNFSQLRRIAAGAFFQSLEPGDQQRKIGSLNCKLARAIWAGILWHMLLHTRDMIGFNVWLDRLYRLYVQR